MRTAVKNNKAKTFFMIVLFAILAIIVLPNSAQAASKKTVTKKSSSYTYKHVYYYNNKDVLYKQVIYRTNKKKQYKSNKHGNAYKKIINYEDGKKLTQRFAYYNKNGKLKKPKFYLYTNGKKHKFTMVNKKYSLSSTYAPGKNKATQEAFKKMKKAAKKDGITFTTLSWYRSYSSQKSVFNYWASIDGVKKAEMYSARPGKSEHQTGMAIDVGSSTKPSTNLETSFAKTSEGKWLKANAHKYGFVIRYPKGKTGKTGYNYEPWHIRYIGGSYENAKYHAKKITEKKITVEEYFKLS